MINSALLNQKGFKSRTKTTAQIGRDLLRADDCALVENTFEDMQWIVYKFPPASNAFGLTSSTKNTNLFYQPMCKHRPVFDPCVFVTEILVHHFLFQLS